MTTDTEPRIIDAHVHVLDNFAAMAPFEDSGRYDRLLELMDEAGVTKAIMLPVVTEHSPKNNEECAQLAREHPDRLAALTNVQLHEAAAADEIARAREVLGAVGVSYYPSSAELDWMLEPDYELIWNAFCKHEMVCNLQVHPTGYAVLLALARRYPDVRFVSNHLGLPSGLDADDASYGGLLEAASLPNVFVKASGFYAAAATPWDFRCPKVLGFISQLIDGLGADRVLWGSDWPASCRFLTYRQNLEIVRTFGEDLDERSRAQVLGLNAASVYKV